MRIDPSRSSIDRRAFLCSAATVVAAAGLGSRAVARAVCPPVAGPSFSISLAQWSLHRSLGRDGRDNLTFPRRAKAFGIDAIEYVNSFFKDKAGDADYLEELNKRCREEGVRSLLIMCDGEGALGDPDEKRRKKAVENHHKWVDAAKTLGCHSIRVNAQSRGNWDEQARLATDGLRQLAEYGAAQDCNVIVENHGGLSSSGKWLAQVLAAVDHPRCGSLPDFGNFRIGKNEDGEMQHYDRYRGVDELMPFAKGVSAKSHDFDEQGDETSTDYRRMLEIVVVKHGYRDYIGIEYEGTKLSEDDGIRATMKLLERVRAELGEAKDG